MQAKRPTWIQIATASIGVAVIWTLGIALIHDLVGDPGYRWDESIASGAAWLVIGPLLGWMRREKSRFRGRRDGRGN